MSQEDRNLGQLPTKVYRFGMFAALSLSVFVSPLFAAQQPGQKTFGSAAEASHALVKAVHSDDETALLSILGEDAKELISSGDPAEDKSNREEFVQKYKQMHRLVNEPDGTTTLYIGAENWPTPIPLVHNGNAWYFDTPAGKKEVLYRRIGKNTISRQTCMTASSWVDLLFGFRNTDRSVAPFLLPSCKMRESVRGEEWIRKSVPIAAVLDM